MSNTASEDRKKNIKPKPKNINAYHRPKVSELPQTMVKKVAKNG